MDESAVAAVAVAVIDNGPSTNVDIYYGARKQRSRAA
jgi:hypothetical protein